MLGLPVVDADAMGRAFPEAQMTSFAIHDLQMYPLTLVDVRDNAVIVARAASWKWMERISRKACVEVGSIASTCKAPRTGKEVKECGILYTTTKAIGIGQAVQAARRRTAIPIEAVLEAEGGKLLFSGKMHDIARRTTEGFLRGTATIDGLDAIPRPHLQLAFQNEFAVGWLDGAPRVMTPDLICVLDTRVRRGDRHRDSCATASASPSSPCPPRRSCSRPKGPRARRPARLRLRPRLPSVFA